MAEFEINGVLYRAGKLDAIRQFHVLRRSMPVLSSLTGVSKAADNPTEVLMPVAQAIAGLSDDDCEYVLGACLGVVQRQQGTRWAPVWNATAKVPMFEDIDMSVMLKLAAQVVRENFDGFLAVIDSILDTED